MQIVLFSLAASYFFRPTNVFYRIFMTCYKHFNARRIRLLTHLIMRFFAHALSSVTYFCVSTYLLIYLVHRSICIIDNGASRHRTRNARFRVRRADHSTTSIPSMTIVRMIATQLSLDQLVFISQTLYGVDCCTPDFVCCTNGRTPKRS